jgi:hypothetical protein
MSEPKVRIAIELLKETDGSHSVETVFANLPPSYIEVEVFTTTATFNAAGEPIDFHEDPGMPHDFTSRYPFEVYTPHTVVYPSDPDGPGAPDEWKVHYGLPGNVWRHVIVINAPTAMRAIARVQESYPQAQIASIRQLDLETEYQQAQVYLDDEVLSVNDEAGTTSAARFRPRKKP